VMSSSCEPRKTLSVRLFGWAYASPIASSKIAWAAASASRTHSLGPRLLQFVRHSRSGYSFTSTKIASKGFALRFSGRCSKG
jgi:hypothetical protein